MPLNPNIPADAEILARLRRYIAEPVDSVIYTNQVLSDMYDLNAGDVNVTAADVWSEKAGKAALLVDISEGASSRKNSQVMSNALKQAAHYSGSSSDATGSGRSVKTRAIER